MTFNIIVPSESVFIDRAVDWSSTVYGYFDVTVTGTGTVGAPILVYGRDFSLAPYPLHQLCATMSVTVNDTTTVVNTNDVANVLFRLADYKKNRKIKTCPSMLDRYQKYPSPAAPTASLAGTSSAVVVSPAWAGTASQTTTTLTVSATTSGALAPGMVLTGGTFSASSIVAYQLTATTWQMVNSASVSSTTATGAGPSLTSATGTTATTATTVGTQPYLTNSPLQGYFNEQNLDEKPNGSWGDFVFTDATGSIPTQGGSASVAVTQPSGNKAVNLIGGVPCFGEAAAAGTYRLFYAFRSTERLLMSPFIFADDHEVSTGLFGVQNIQLLFNFQNPIGAGRLLRFNGSTFLSAASTSAITITNSSFQTTPFANPVVNIQYLTPSLDVPLPAKNIVPFQDFPRYISQQNYSPMAPSSSYVGWGPNSVVGASSPAGTTVLASQTITLSAIPDLLAIYVKPNSYTTNTISAVGSAVDVTSGDWFMPITNISINFDNYAGLLSSHSQEQLYRMSVMNGLEMDWDQWRGYANCAQSYALSSAVPNWLALTGGPLLLKPGRDIVLQAGQAPSLVGNFSLQFQLTVQNQTGLAQLPQIYVIAITSGFLETIKGSSRIIKGILTEQDILSAPMGPGSSDAHKMDRVLGSGMVHDASMEMGREKKEKHGKGRSGRGMDSYRK